jgi:peptidoglycan/LPS O-acetylase OafA/YrhL
MVADTAGSRLTPMDAERAAVPDVTATGKPHFEVLDGLRGSAALMVVLFHIQGITVDWAQGKLMFPHAYLAVDFFFVLSGFVIGYAYDDRWGRMTIGAFVRLRLIRLHPLVVLGTILGLISYLFDPFGAAKQTAPAWAIALAFGTSLLALPSVPLANRWTDTHPLNGPGWTLFQEYIANLVYALGLRKAPTSALAVLVAVAAIGTLTLGLSADTMDRGSAWEGWWGAPLRLCYPFLAGLLIYRVRDRLPALRLGFLPLTVLLIVAFTLPQLPSPGSINRNGLYEALCVLLLFPLVVITGAHSNSGRGMDRLCHFSGRISYPIYITHFPFLYVWMNYVASGSGSPGTLATIGIALVPFTILMAYLAARFWDEPIRARLRRRKAVATVA